MHGQWVDNKQIFTSIHPQKVQRKSNYVNDKAGTLNSSITERCSRIHTSIQSFNIALFLPVWRFSSLE